MFDTSILFILHHVRPPHDNPFSQMLQNEIRFLQPIFNWLKEHNPPSATIIVLFPVEQNWTAEVGTTCLQTVASLSQTLLNTTILPKEKNIFGPHQHFCNIQVPLVCLVFL